MRLLVCWSVVLLVSPSIKHKLKLWKRPFKKKWQELIFVAPVSSETRLIDFTGTEENQRGCGINREKKEAEKFGF